MHGISVWRDAEPLGIKVSRAHILPAVQEVTPHFRRQPFGFAALSRETMSHSSMRCQPRVGVSALPMPFKV